MIPCEAHSRRGLGGAQWLSVCSRLAGSCWGQIQGPQCLGQREPVPTGGGETCHVEELVGRQSSSQPPVGSSGRLRSGSSLSQDCARRVRLGFSGAARRPGSGGPEMTTKVGLAPVGVHRLTPHSTSQKGSWCRWWGPGTLQPFSGHKANLAPQAPLDPSGSPASAVV